MSLCYTVSLFTKGQDWANYIPFYQRKWWDGVRKDTPQEFYGKDQVFWPMGFILHSHFPNLQLFPRSFQPVFSVNLWSSHLFRNRWFGFTFRFLSLKWKMDDQWSRELHQSPQALPNCMLQFMGSQRAGHDWATELNWTEKRRKGYGR